MELCTDLEVRDCDGWIFLTFQKDPYFRTSWSDGWPEKRVATRKEPGYRS